MTGNIDLNALRAKTVGMTPDGIRYHLRVVHLSDAELLALLDTAEAAIEYERTSWTHTDPPAKRRLRQTLAPFGIGGAA